MSEPNALSLPDIGQAPTVAALFPLYLDAVNRATAPEASDDDCNLWCARMQEIETAIIAAPSETAQDVARKVLVAAALNSFREIDGPNAPDLWAQLHKLAGVNQ